MSFYSLNLRLDSKPCVVIGGGEVAFLKTKALINSDAQVKVISPQFIDRFEDVADRIERINRKYIFGDLAGASLAISAAGDRELNKLIRKEAADEKVLLNVADEPELCDFYTPSVLRRDELIISISTNGKFPLLSKKIRLSLEKEFGSEYEAYLQVLGKARNKVITEFTDVNKRREVLEKILDLDIIELLRQGKSKEIEEKINKIIIGS